MEITKLPASSGTAPPLPALGQSVQKNPVLETPAPVAPTPPSANLEQIQSAIDSVKKMVEVVAPNSLEFSVDADSGKAIVRITDAKTGEMIRQIPSQELLEIAKSLDKFQGMLLKQIA